MKFIKSFGVAHWEIWGGWRGNHDQRISGAKCSKCGWEHPVVYGDTKKLSKFCGGCGRKIIGVIET